MTDENDPRPFPLWFPFFAGVLVGAVLGGLFL